MARFSIQLLFLAYVVVLSAAGQRVRAEPPATYYWSGKHLAAVRESPAARTPAVRRALAVVDQHATAALERGPYSVVDKQLVPPSGDKHDYLSFSRYWWPDPTSPDGLPYIRHDGVVNRELLAQATATGSASFTTMSSRWRWRPI